MNRINIEPKDLTVKATDIWADRWLILTAGDFKSGKYNPMTVAWGSIGTMWHKPFAQVVVRPQRYTFEFMERYPDFTLSVLPAEQKKAMQLMGSVSGRDRDKISEAGLTVMASEIVQAPAYDEAELILECRTLYTDKMRPEGFKDPALDNNYKAADYHRIYFGEILRVSGLDKYRS